MTTQPTFQGQPCEGLLEAIAAVDAGRRGPAEVPNEGQPCAEPDTLPEGTGPAFGAPAFDRRTRTLPMRFCDVCGGICTEEWYTYRGEDCVCPACRRWFARMVATGGTR